MTDSHFELLGWHAPGDLPTVRSSRSREEWLADATSFHEHIHYALTHATSHGHAQLVLAGMVDDCEAGLRQRGLACLAHLHEASRVVHEGCATFNEWLFLSSEYPDQVEERLNSLPLDYRVAMDLFSWVIAGQSKKLRIGMAQLVSSGLALACLNTRIFDCSTEGLLSTIETQMPADWTLTPDERLSRIVELPREEVWTLVPFVEHRLVRVFGTLDHPLDERASPIVDRAIEAWIKTRRVFDVGERIAHAHRQPLVDSVISATAIELGVKPRIKPIDRSPTPEFVERMVHQDFASTRSSQVHHLRNAVSFSESLALIERSEPEVRLLYSRALVRGPVWPGIDDPWTAFLTIMSIDESQEDGDATVAWVSQPDECINLSRPFSFGVGLESQLCKSTLTLDLGDYLALSPSERRELAENASALYVFCDAFGEFPLRLLSEHFGSLSSVEHFKVPFVGPRLVVVSTSLDQAQFMFFASAVGIRETARRFRQVEQGPTWSDSALLPMDHYLGAWPCLYGIFRSDDLPGEG